MPNPRLICDAIVAALRSIPDLNAAMTVIDSDGNAVCRINAFHYGLGDENQRATAIYKMPAPSMLVAWDGTIPSNVNGTTIYKERFFVYFRMGNAAGLTDPVGYEDLWHLVRTGPVGDGGPPITRICLLPDLEIMDPPGNAHAVDEDSVDRFVGTFVIPAIGDQ